MMLLTLDPHDMWGICSRPAAYDENDNRILPRPSAWTWLAGHAMVVPNRPAYEPEEIPPRRTAAWREWEPKIRRRFIEGRALGFWDCEVIHPDDELLLAAAAIVWNGDMPDTAEGRSVRVWQWEQRHTWWIIGLPPHLDAATVRELMREQRRLSLPA